MRKLLGTLLMGLAIGAQAQPVTLVELGNFFCGHCAQMNQYHDEFVKAAEATGGSFDFAPIYDGVHSKWATKAYYSGLSVIVGTQEKVANTLFSVANVSGDKLETPESVCHVLANHVDNVNYDTCLDRTNGNTGWDRTVRSLQLLQYLVKQKYLSDNIEFPVFVIELNGKIATVLSSADQSDMSQLASMVVSSVKEAGNA